MLLNYASGSGLPGQIADTGPHRIERVRFKAASVAETYTLNLNPVPVTAYGSYQISVMGSPISLGFVPGVAVSPTADFTAQWVALINRYGAFWASITAPGVITLTSRTPGVSNIVTLGSGMSAAILTKTINALTPRPLLSGTLVFWSNNYTSDPDTHLEVTTYDQVPSVNALRDCAGVVLRNLENYGEVDQVNGSSLEIMRNGVVWVRNYGLTPITRSTPVLYNQATPTPLLPGGGFGIGAVLGAGLVDRLQYDSYATSMGTARLRINLV